MIAEARTDERCSARIMSEIEIELDVIGGALLWANQ
jgi:hypothetical protein